MGTLEALFQTLGGVAQSGAKAKEDLAAEELKKKQVYSQLESAALQREHLQELIRQSQHPVDPNVRMFDQLEKSGVYLTPEEKKRILGAVPKELQPKMMTKLEQDKNSDTGWAYVTRDQMSGHEYSRVLNAPPQRGLIESETTTTDPLTGLSTVSHRKPLLGGKAGAAPAKGAATQPKRAVDLFTPLSPPPRLAGAKAGGKKAGAVSPPTTTAKVLPLDPDGHIPASPLVNPHVREAANELLDGQDKLKIQPSKLADAAATLARKYGWEQGKFTPKEQTMLRETTTFLQRAMRDDSMKALDESVMARLKLQQVALNPDKEGFIGRGLSAVAAMNMTDSQKKFIQTYNQLVGTISGLSQLVRSGRATEATIERLKAELPNPTTTKDSKDAMQRLQRIMDEINVAMRKGAFTGAEGESGTTPAQSIINKALGR